eukprot:7376387-Prymnesium_polylepis.2
MAPKLPPLQHLMAPELLWMAIRSTRVPWCRTESVALSHVLGLGMDLGEGQGRGGRGGMLGRPRVVMRPGQAPGCCRWKHGVPRLPHRATPSFARTWSCGGQGQGREEHAGSPCAQGSRWHVLVVGPTATSCDSAQH